VIQRQRRLIQIIGGLDILRVPGPIVLRREGSYRIERDSFDGFTRRALVPRSGGKRLMAFGVVQHGVRSG